MLREEHTSLHYFFYLSGYKTFKGQVFHSGEVSDLYEGLKLNGITKFSHILTGE